MSKVIASNHKAYRDYAVIESLECGIELKGSEVKSIRAGFVNLNDSFARPEGSDLTLFNTHVNPYAQASYLNVESARPRRLLLHKNQIERLSAKLMQKGLTLIPLKIYINERGFVKIELGLCKGKRQYDKRGDIKKRETDVQMRRMLKNIRK